MNDQATLTTVAAAEKKASDIIKQATEQAVLIKEKAVTEASLLLNISSDQEAPRSLLPNKRLCVEINYITKYSRSKSIKLVVMAVHKMLKKCFLNHVPIWEVTNITKYFKHATIPAMTHFLKMTPGMKFPMAASSYGGGTTDTVEWASELKTAYKSTFQSFCARILDITNATHSRTKVAIMAWEFQAHFKAVVVNCTTLQ